MDVFIKEPLIDWEKLARRLVREQQVIVYVAPIVTIASTLIIM